jgi:hypothetical protein
MSSTNIFGRLSFFTGLLAAGCISSAPPVEPLPSPPVIIQLALRPAPGDVPRLCASPDPTILWIPKYIITGISSGLMVEYLNLPRTPAQVRRAVIDAWRTDIPVSSSRKQRNIERDSLGSTAFQRISAAVNGLGQAFIPLRPGTYMVRQLSPWAEQIYTREVLVRDGSYSVLTIRTISLVEE